MATLLKQFRFAWKDLNDALNKIVTAVNSNAPLEGTGIHLDETGGQGVRINKADDKSGNPKDSNQQQQGAATDPLAGTTWTTVTIVDPGTCTQSQIQVLTRPVP